jgi:hypothetical protein
MEKSNFNLNVDGGVKLPIGYRFHPTDEELVVHYLKRKVYGIPLPASVIPQFDVLASDPRNFPGDLKEKRYFFSRRKGNENCCKREITGTSGNWRVTGKQKHIVSYESNQVVGIRKTLVYNQPKTKRTSHETKWIVHEYCLLGSVQIPSLNQISSVEYGDWLVYSLFQKKRKPKNGKRRLEEPSVVDTIEEEQSFDDDNGPPQPSSPSSDHGNYSD